MSEPVALEHQRIVPYLTYADAPAAIDWLCRVFGFEEVRRMEMGDGRIGNAALSFCGELVMLSSVFEEAGNASPRDLPGLNQSITVYVDDVDAHFAQAEAEGATILLGLQDQFWGTRTYWVEDLEGHRWTFQQQLAEVSDEDAAETMRNLTTDDWN